MEHPEKMMLMLAKELPTKTITEFVESTAISYNEEPTEHSQNQLAAACALFVLHCRVRNRGLASVMKDMETQAHVESLLTLHTRNLS